MTAIYENEHEAALPGGAVEALAREMQRSTDEVRTIYEGMYRALRTQAHVTDFLPVLVARHAREALRRSSSR